MKELCQKSLEILNQIMRRSVYTQKKIISASIETLQITFHLNQQQNSLL